MLAFAWVFVAGLLLLQFWPAIPQSKAQWALFIAFGPPLYVLAEALSDKLYSKRRGYGIVPPRFSIKRGFVALAATLAVIALVWGA